MLWKAGYTEGKQMWEVGEEERRERGRKNKSESKREPENQRVCPREHMLKSQPRLPGV